MQTRTDLPLDDLPGQMTVRFTSSRDGRFRYDQQLWDSKRDQIYRLYIVARKPLKEVMEVMQDPDFNPRSVPSMKAYKSQLKKWRFIKKQSHGVAPRTCQGPSPPVSLVTPLDRFQTIVNTQMRHLLLEDLDTSAWTWGLGPYGDSVTGKSVASIIQGNLLANRGHRKEGFLLINRGFATIDHVFQDHTLHGLLDMLTHLHVYCDVAIIQKVWEYLALYPNRVPDRRHQFHETLGQLSSLSTTADLCYESTILSTQSQIYNVFRQEGAHKDPSLLSMMANGVARQLSMPLWRGTDWREFLMTSLNEMRNVMRDKHGVLHDSYHSWLWRHLGSVRSLCGEDSDAASELASNIQRELEGCDPKEGRLRPECWLTMAQYHWKRVNSIPDASNPRVALAISLLENYTTSRWLAGARNDAEVGWLHLLETWQRMAGSEAEADRTLQKCSAMVKAISAAT